MRFPPTHVSETRTLYAHFLVSQLFTSATKFLWHRSTERDNASGTLLTRFVWLMITLASAHPNSHNLGMKGTLLLLLCSIQTVHCELVFVAGLWMHGDTAPGAIPYPKDANDESNWPRGFGALTNVSGFRSFLNSFLSTE